ncbi:hypothetical protein BH10CYA1_BH10CYA1_51880 [soil metagenome]
MERGEVSVAVADAPTSPADTPSNSSIEAAVLPTANMSPESTTEPSLEPLPEPSPEPSPDLNSPECPSCWKALRATDKFCCWCGEAQPNRVLPFLKLCLECSTFLPEKANYCYACGTDVGYSSRRKVRVPHELFKDEESEFFPRFDA